MGSLEDHDFGFEPIETLMQPVRHMTEKNVAQMPELKSGLTGERLEGAEHKLDPKLDEVPRDSFEESAAFCDDHHSLKHTAETSE